LGQDGRRLGLVDVADEAARHRHSRADEFLDAVAARGRQHELVAFEDPDRARVGAEERRRVLDDFVQHRVRVELGGEQAAGARELLRERAAGGRPSWSLLANGAGNSNAPVSSSSPSLRGMSTAVKSPPSASAAAWATASSVAVSESGSPRTVAMLEKPRCTRACRVRSSY